MYIKQVLNNQSAFTLVEIVVVMAIISVLASLVTGAIRVARNQARHTELLNDARTIMVGLEAYNSSNKIIHMI